ncbi:hypothetical protein [Aliikangiella sp. G2MR2-5]|uniref:hypothetical protein n=1 Tax=Aliikangiella sp. G2MR2-5 TaxID=2788943 RepID=UPI0018AC2E17|nr:hypothetical protein [Aliikangiella sp. G2MR2-5]
MKRLYYLTDDIQSTQEISDDLHETGVSDWNFHVISKDEKGLYKRHIHSANALQKTDLIHSTERGFIKGLAVGTIVFFLISPIPIHGRLPESGFLLAIFFVLLLGGLFHGALLGLQNENIRLKPFQQEIENGRFLIMIDVPNSQVDKIENLMFQNHPEAILRQESPVWIWPFSHPGTRGV